MQSSASVEIDRSIEDVFEIATQQVSKWSIIVVEDQVVDEKPGMVGTTFRVVTEDRGQRMEFDGVVTQHEPPHLHASTMRGKQFDIEATYTLEDLGNRTRLTQDSKVNAKGFLKVIFFLFGWLMNRSSCDAAQKELVSLKSLAESNADSYSS